MFAFARIGAAIAMRIEDYYPNGAGWWVRLHEKGGKPHEMPAHHLLATYLGHYIAAAGVRACGDTPLFRTAIGGTMGALTEKPMSRVDTWRLIQRRAKIWPSRPHPLPHFRATGIASCLEAGGTLESAQAIARKRIYDQLRSRAAHQSPT